MVCRPAGKTFNKHLYSLDLSREDNIKCNFESNGFIKRICYIWRNSNSRLFNYILNNNKYSTIILKHEICFSRSTMLIVFLFATNSRLFHQIYKYCNYNLTCILKFSKILWGESTLKNCHLVKLVCKWK